MDALPIGISIAAFLLALAGFLYTLRARPVPLLDAYDRVGLGNIAQAHIVSVYNVGRKPLAIRNLGVVRKDDSLAFDMPTATGPAASNPPLPHVVEPGGVATFYMSLDLDPSPERGAWTYRMTWVKGRERDGSARIAHAEVSRPKLDDLIYPM
jgi:hypothetical protein